MIKKRRWRIAGAIFASLTLASLSTCQKEIVEYVTLQYQSVAGPGHQLKSGLEKEFDAKGIADAPSLGKEQPRFKQNDNQTKNSQLGTGNETGYRHQLSAKMHLNEAKKVHYEATKPDQRSTNSGTIHQDIPPTLEETISLNSGFLRFGKETNYIQPRYSVNNDPNARDALILLDISSSMESNLFHNRVSQPQKIPEKLKEELEQVKRAYQKRLDDLDISHGGFDINHYERIVEQQLKICQEALKILKDSPHYKKDLPQRYAHIERVLESLINNQEECEPTLTKMNFEFISQSRTKNIGKDKAESYRQMVSYLDDLIRRQTQLKYDKYQMIDYSNRKRKIEYSYKQEVYQLMQWNPESLINGPAVAAIAIARHYIEEKKTAVKGILFNNYSYHTPFVRDLEELARFFAKHPSGGTKLDADLLTAAALDPARPNSHKPLDLYIISDFEIDNINQIVAQTRKIANFGRVYVIEVGREGKTTYLFGKEAYRVRINSYKDIQTFYKKFVQDMKK